MPRTNGAQDAKDKKFLDLWRDLELALKDEGPLMVSQLESNLESRSRPADASKLRMCRLVRNFMVHDGPGFAGATDAMCDFVAGMIYEVRRARGTARDHMMTVAKYGMVGLDEKVGEAGAVVFNKGHGDAVVLDAEKKPVGIFGPKAMAAAIADAAGKKPVSYLAKYLAPVKSTVPDDAPMKEAPDHKAIVTDKVGRCVGVLSPERSWS